MRSGERTGANSQGALRGARKRGSCRGDGGALNRRRAASLGFALLQYLFDHAQRSMARAHSDFLMAHARELRAALVRNGFPEEELPELIWWRRARAVLAAAADAWNPAENDADEAASALEKISARPSISQ